MVTLKEYQEAPDTAIFVHKDSKFGQAKTIMRFKLNQISFAFAKGITKAGGDPNAQENLRELQALLAETLEHFEIQELKIVEEGTPAHFIKPKKHKSKDGKGKFCYKCGLQKLNTSIVEEGDKVLRVCQECLGI